MTLPRDTSLTTHLRRVLSSVAVVAAVLLCAPAALAAVEEPVGLTSAGAVADSEAIAPFMSADGRYVAFASAAADLVSADTNGSYDIFVYDRQTDSVRRVSLSSSGAQADGDCRSPVMSADGRCIAFLSGATNLVPEDTNGSWDVFVRDLATGETRRASLSSDGSEPDADCTSVSISADGSVVCFVCEDANGLNAVFVRDLAAGVTKRISAAGSGGQPDGESDRVSVSGDGRYVAFDSTADDLISADSNGTWDVFVYDRETGEIVRASVDSEGSQGDGDSCRPSISADGRYVAFESDSDSLAPGDTNAKRDVFVRDLVGGTTERVSVADSGSEGDDDSGYASLSADGRVVAFASAATDLVPGDTNGACDVFVRDRSAQSTQRVSVWSTGTEGHGDSTTPAASADGGSVAFVSTVDGSSDPESDVRVDVFAADLGATSVAVEPPTLSAAPSLYQESDSRLTYMGKWASADTPWASLGRFAYTNSPGAVVTASFTGTSIKLTAKKGPQYGKAKVRVDGGAVEYIDFYSPTAVCQQFVYQREGLSDTPHTLTLEWAGTKNNASSGYYISLDVLVVQGSLNQAPALTRYEQGASQFSYTGDWGTYSSGSASGGSFTYAASKGSAVNITFQGTGLVLVANTGPVYGKARMTLDGGDPFYVDLFSMGSLYQQAVYSTGALDQGTHNLTIQWTGVGYTFAEGRYIDIDAVQVMGSLVTAPAAQAAPTLCEQDDSKLVYAGDWREGARWGASGGTFKYTTAQNTSLVIKFNGTCLDLMAKKAPEYGRAKVTLDGVDAGYVDFYDPGWVYQQLVYTTGQIGAGQHTLKLEWTGTKNVASTGYLINVDAVVVCGCLVETPVPRSYQQSAGQLAYAGAWIDVVTTAADGGNFYYGNSPEASLLIEFDGTSLDWYAKTSFVYGKALLSLDGGAAVEVDMYSAATLYRQCVYSTGLLENGRHTISIAWSGRKNDASVGYAINIDSFHTLGSLATLGPESLTSDRCPFAMTYQDRTRVTYTLAYAPAWVSAIPDAGGDLSVKVWSMSGPALPLSIESPEVHSVATESGGGAGTVRLDLARYQRYRVMSLPASDSRAARIVVDVYKRSDGPAEDGPPLVYVDPGHGGSALGTMGVISNVPEKTVNLAVARLVEQYASEKGLRVVLTRHSDVDLGLQERCDLANNAHANIFISIHCNAYFNTTTGGTETFYQEKTADYTVAAKALATTIQNRVLAALGLADRGARTYYVGTLAVLNRTVMPAALVELAFMSNPTEDALITSAAGQDKSAKAIRDAICDYLGWSTSVYTYE